MFSKDITSSDSFLSMSSTAQNLYFHLGMEADDDGFAPFTKVSKMLGTSHDDMAQLLGRGFLLQFPYGVFIIRDWKVNNQIRADRYKTTIYQKELSMLETNESYQYFIINDNRGLFDNMEENNHVETSGKPNGNQMATQYRLGKDRLGKDSRESAPSVKINNFSSKKDINDNVLQEISDTYEVPIDFVRDCWDSAINWLDAKGKTQKNYKAFLSNWVKRERASWLLKSKKLQRSNNGTRIATFRE